MVWTAKYQYQVLGGDVGQLCRELLREIAISKEVMIYAGSSQPGSRANDDQHTATVISILGGTVSRPTVETK